MNANLLRKISFILLSGCFSLSALAATPGLGPKRSSVDLWSTDLPTPNETVRPDAVHDPQASFKYVSLSPIYFDHNRHKLSYESRMALDAAVEYLKKHEDTIKRVLIEGFTDSTASMGYNDKLAYRRTDMVRSYLLFHGVNSNLLVTTANGERAPTDINWTPLGRARNRQVAIHAIH